MNHYNIEIKARCSDQDKIRRYLESRQADFKGLDHQIDTYFNVSSGRLKLREGNIENFLIYYLRDDQQGPKHSTATLYNAKSSKILKDVLTKALGRKVVVDKKREIYFIKNVKFHIDTVKNLGMFMEIEVIDETGEISEEVLREQCQYYMDAMGISDKDLISKSYSDLLWL